MPLSSIGDGVVHNGRRVLSNCEVYNGSNPSLFGKTMCGPAYFITRGDNLLRVPMIYFACGYFYYACGCFNTRADTDMI